MTHSHRLLPIIFLSALLNACINKSEVHLTSRNFENEVEQQQNLVFTFDRDLAADSVLNKWDTVQYIKFKPEVKGQFKWNTNRELMFSPLTGFRPSTDYNATVTGKVLFNNMILSIQKENSFQFHTPYLKLISAGGYWSMSEKNKNAAALSVSLNFNNDIDPSSLTPVLHIILADKPVQYSLSSTTVNKTITVTIDDIDKEHLANTPIKISVGKGLKCSGSNYTTKEIQELSMIIPSPDKLEITQAAGEFSGTEAMIHVYTNQAVDETDINKLISIDPKVNFTIEKISDGFYIKGGFTTGLSYQVTVSKDLKGALGGKLESNFSQLIPFGALEPDIRFVSKTGIYLSTLSSKNIAISVINIPRVQVQIKKIYENNILHYYRNNRYRNYNYGYYNDESEGEDEGYGETGDNNSYDYSQSNFDLYGDQVFSRYYDTRDLPKVNGSQLLNLSFDEQNAYKGIYLVDVSSSNSLYKHDSKIISISDIGLITKRTDDEVYVFANSIKTAEPISGASVSFISSNNQTLFTASTNGDGVAVFRDVKSKAPGFNLAMITARSNGDFNYLMLNDSRVNDSRFDVGGRRVNQSGCMAFVYGDRNIYRPGETIYINSIVLSEKWEPIGPVPVKIKLLLPDGKEFKTVRGTLDKQGAFSTSFPLPVATETGTYELEIYSSNDVLLQSKDISVEEFMPDRINVKLDLNKTDYTSKDSIVASVSAVNLFGPPAADRKYEVELSMAYKYFSAKDYPGYEFGIYKSQDKEFPKVLREGKTNATGMAKEIFSLDEAYKGIGVLEGKVFATVFDETGRPVNRLKRFDVFTQDIFYGIKMSDYYVNARENIAIPLIAVDKNGKPHSAQAEVKIIRHDWYSMIEKNSNGEMHYVSHPNDRIMLDQTVDIGVSGYVLNYLPRESGDFEVRINKPGNEHYVSSNFYSYGYGFTQNTSFSVNTEGQVDIKFDKEKYNPGDQANILFTTPFSGKLLVTVECDKVLEYYYINTDKKTAKLNLPVKESYLPNVYITATLFRPLDDGAIPLTVGHGFAPMIVNAEKNKLPVTIVAVTQSRSKTKQTIKIKTRPEKDIEMTVAVVDEGILQLKNYKTPDPYGFFYQKKALNVSASDLYNVLLPDLKLKRSVTGGDEANLEKRVNPLTNKRVKLVAFWSGILHSNTAGEANYTIDIPQFSGDLRIMACAYKNKAFGSADAHIKVADPVVISASIPRFLSPKDTLIMPVTFTNTTNKTTRLDASLQVDGALSISGSSDKSLTVNANTEQKAEFKIIASPETGGGSITVNAKASGETFTDKTEITIRPSTSLLKVTEAGMIKGNESHTINLKTDFIPSSVATKLIISQNPMVQFSKQLNYLLGYPYGCCEQTVSRAFPQIYYAELVKNVKNAQNTMENPNYNVQEAIRKIEMMYLYNGAVSYWPTTGLTENWWATAYVVHFLLEAKKAGYEVNDNKLERCIEYLSQKIKGRETETYYFWNDSDILIKKTIAKKENLYSLYILSLYGKPDISSMNYYKSNIDLLALDSRYLLACTYLAVGDRKSYDAILPKAFEGERSQNCFGGSFYSYVRDEAISLNALIENDPDNPQVGIMVRHLSQQMNKDRYLNTQECAFAFLALGKFMKRQEENKVTADIRVGDKSIATFDGKDVTITKGISGKPITVNVTGKGNLYYFIEEEGISAKGEYKEEDNFLKVRKSFYNRFGQPVSVHDIKQGDLLAVKLSVQNTERSRIENVVVTDMLPAGFEIENPRVGEVQEMNWIKDDTQPDYFDVRDDRINYFTTVDEKVRNFYYLVRAVSPGSYVMGPVSADAMYNGEYHSYNGGGTVKITQ